VSIIADVMKIGFAPEGEPNDWLESADSAVDFVVKNAHSDEIVLYTITGQTFIHAVLTPISSVSPPDFDDLMRSTINAYDSWSLTHESGGGKPDRMYLASPLTNSSSDSLKDGHQLVFRRSFQGVDNGLVRTEISQMLVQTLEVYWLDEYSSYCKLNDDGDVEQIIRVLDVSADTGGNNDVIVTIKADALHRFMAVTETALAIKFDFTRTQSKNFSGWQNPGNKSTRAENLFYHYGKQPFASFVNGFYIMTTQLTKEQVIETESYTWPKENKEYATFIAHDWKNNRLADICCSPDSLSSYFDADSTLPFQITPAFFSPEVLQRYKTDPEKYSLDQRRISSRAGWELQTYDVNDAGQVHSYLCYLACLPYKEQLYWKAFNEQPKGPISERAYKTDILGSWDEFYDPLTEVKATVGKLNASSPEWWLDRDGSLAANLHYPLTTSPEEWANSILALDQYLVEGFVAKAIKEKLKALDHKHDPSFGSIKLVEEYAVAKGSCEDDAKQLVEPLKKLHFLRTKVKGHAAVNEKAALIKSARMAHGSLSAHFFQLTIECEKTLRKVNALLGGQS